MGTNHTRKWPLFKTDKKRRRFREKSSLLRRFHPKGVAWGANSADFDPEAVQATIRSMGRFFGPRRYFRVDARGWENLPASPVMLVSNHSGGTLFLDSWGLLYAWYTHFGAARAIHPAVHELLLGNETSAPTSRSEVRFRRTGMSRNVSCRSGAGTCW